MLVGDCGVGKTTLLWQFAVNAARSRLNVWLTALLEQKKKVHGLMYTNQMQQLLSADTE